MLIPLRQPAEHDLLDSSLRLEESSRANILSALGQPFGEGSALLPNESQPQTVWSYYYEEGSLQDPRRILLFVFFDEKR